MLQNDCKDKTVQRVFSSWTSLVAQSTNSRFKLARAVQKATPVSYWILQMSMEVFTTSWYSSPLFEPNILLVLYLWRQKNWAFLTNFCTTIFYFQAVRNSCHCISANDSTYDHVASFMCCWLHVFVQQNWARALVAKLCWTIFLRILWDWEMYINLWDSQKILESWHAWKICPATGSLWILSEESGWIISCQSYLPIYFSFIHMYSDCTGFHKNLKQIEFLGQ